MVPDPDFAPAVAQNKPSPLAIFFFSHQGEKIHEGKEKCPHAVRWSRVVVALFLLLCGGKSSLHPPRNPGSMTGRVGDAASQCKSAPLAAPSKSRNWRQQKEKCRQQGSSFLKRPLSCDSIIRQPFPSHRGAFVENKSFWFFLGVVSSSSCPGSLSTFAPSMSHVGWMGLFEKVQVLGIRREMRKKNCVPVWFSRNAPDWMCQYRLRRFA